MKLSTPLWGLDFADETTFEVSCTCGGGGALGVLAIIKHKTLFYTPLYIIIYIWYSIIYSISYSISYIIYIIFILILVRGYDIIFHFPSSMSNTFSDDEQRVPRNCQIRLHLQSFLNQQRRRNWSGLFIWPPSQWLLLRQQQLWE